MLCTLLELSESWCMSFVSFVDLSCTKYVAVTVKMEKKKLAGAMVYYANLYLVTERIPVGRC